MNNTIFEWLKSGTQRLTDAGIDSARLDCLLLLEDVTQANRAHLLAHQDNQLTIAQKTTLDTLLNRRINHEPLAYIRGHVAFYGNNFMVNSHVLVPRPESEDIITLLTEYRDVPTIIDVGTGSGALAISAALAYPEAEIIAVDIDPHCLSVAQRNATTLTTSIQFSQGDLLRGLKLDAYNAPLFVLANLPYVPTNYPINDAAKHEPEKALFAGRDGLDLYRIMFDQLAAYDDMTIIVLTESLLSQHQALAGIAFDHGFDRGTTKGLIQTFTHLA